MLAPSMKWYKFEPVATTAIENGFNASIAVPSVTDSLISSVVPRSPECPSLGPVAIRYVIECPSKVLIGASSLGSNAR